MNFVHVVGARVPDTVVVIVDVVCVVVVVIGTVGGVGVVPVAGAEIREGGGVDAVRAGVVVRSVARIVSRLETVETGVAVVGALIQNRGDRGDARSSAPLAILLARYFDHHRCLAGSGTGILKKSRQSQRIHPLIHTFATIRREMVGSHVGVLGFERELSVDLVLGLAYSDPVRW